MDPNAFADGAIEEMLDYCRAPPSLPRAEAIVYAVRAKDRLKPGYVLKHGAKVGTTYGSAFDRKVQDMFYAGTKKVDIAKAMKCTRKTVDSALRRLGTAGAQKSA